MAQLAPILSRISEGTFETSWGSPSTKRNGKPATVGTPQPKGKIKAWQATRRCDLLVERKTVTDGPVTWKVTVRLRGLRERGTPMDARVLEIGQCGKLGIHPIHYLPREIDLLPYLYVLSFPTHL